MSGKEGIPSKTWGDEMRERTKDNDRIAALEKELERAQHSASNWQDSFNKLSGINADLRRDLAVRDASEKAVIELMQKGHEIVREICETKDQPWNCDYDGCLYCAAIAELTTHAHGKEAVKLQREGTGVNGE